MNWPPPCIHRCGCGGLCDSGHTCPMADNAPPLCPACQAAYDEDPSAYAELGDHPEGLANWKAEQEAIAAYAAEVNAAIERGKATPPDPSIPF